MHTRLALVALLTLQPAVPCALRVWVVAPVQGPGVDFTQVQPAIDAANNGDIVLVRAGSYLSFRIDGKALSVIADGTTVSLTPNGVNGVVVTNVTAQQAVVVRGFAQAAALTALSVSNCAGPVLVEGCSFTGLASTFGGRGGEVIDSSRVTLARCSFSCITSRPDRGGPGLEASSSTLFLHNCSVLGMSGSTVGAHGSPAANLQSSWAYASGCIVRGGNGGLGTNFGTCSPPGNGGDGMRLLDAATTVTLLDCEVLAGLAGTPGIGCPPALPGQAISGPGTSIVLSGSASEVSAAARVRHGQNLDLVCRGPADTPSFLALSVRHAPVFLPACRGVLHADLAGGVVLFAGVLSSTGQLNLSIPIPALPLPGLVLYFQLGVTPATGCYLGSPSAALMLDPRF